MKYRLAAIALTITLLLLAGRPALAEKVMPVNQNGPVTAQIFVYPDGQRPSQALTLAAPYTDVAAHGTMWMRESNGAFKTFSAKGWGTVTQVKAAGLQWVHIAVPLIPYLEDSSLKIFYVEFCAQSTNGASTKPVTLDLWGHNTKFYSAAITWPAVNTIQCVGASFAAGIWEQDLGVSVRINYANATDKVTLYKAWVHMGH
jgi:hypothetical protein